MWRSYGEGVENRRKTWIAQFAGAILAPLVLEWLVGPVANMGATLPKMGTLPAFGMEVILTTLLVLAIIGTATGSRLVGPREKQAATGSEQKR